MSYLTLFANVACALLLAKTNKVVDKIHFEVNASPSKHPANARQVLEMLRTLSKVFGYSCSAIIVTPVLVFD